MKDKIVRISKENEIMVNNLISLYKEKTGFKISFRQVVERCIEDIYEDMHKRTDSGGAE